MNLKLIQLDSNRLQPRSQLLNQSIVMLVIEVVFEQIVLYGQEMSSEYKNLSLYPRSNFILVGTSTELHPCHDQNFTRAS